MGASAFAAQNRAAIAAALHSCTEVALTAVVILVVVAIVITVAVAVAWCLELPILTHIAITGQYFPFIRFTRLQSSQLQGVMGASARVIRGTPRLIAARHAIADMVGAGRIGGPVDHGRVPGDV